MTSLADQGLPLPTQHLMHPKYRPDIDGLRAIAVLSVVGYHAFPYGVPGGFIGVDIFFVISGYLISSIIYGSLERQDFSFTKFYVRRIKRILPALLLVLISCYAFGWFALLPGEYKQLGRHIVGGSSFLSNFVLWNESGYFDTTAEIKPLLHLWSLGIEEQFYIFWPLILWAAWKMRLNMLTLTLALLGTSFVLNVINIGLDPSGTFYLPQTRAWELLTGSVLAYTVAHHGAKSRAAAERLNRFITVILMRPGTPSAGAALRNTLSIIGVTLLAIGFTSATSAGFPGWQAIIPCAGAILIISGGPYAWINRHILGSKLLVSFGLISFPLYLWHWPLLSYARIIAGGVPSRETRILLVIASIALAICTYIFIEKPIRFKSIKKPIAKILIALLAAIGAIGYSTYRLDGLPSRFPAAIQKLADFRYEFLKDARGQDCWITLVAAYDGFNKKCFIDAGNQPGSGILIWGDSHAARLYPGLELVFGSTSVILQTTRNSCPPILDFGGQICTDSNKYILDSLKQVQPHTVILFGAWGRYGADWGVGSEKREKLLRTISEIRASGISNIVVLGPSPEWTADLPKILYNNWKHDLLRRIPERLSGKINQESKQVDDYFREFVPQSNSTFVSVFDFLCNTAGCITHLTGEPAKLTTWDYGHLTTDGATIVARKLLDSGAIN